MENNKSKTQLKILCKVEGVGFGVWGLGHKFSDITQAMKNRVGRHLQNYMEAVLFLVVGTSGY